jgi:nicotinic acid phosphoribosyltransferase
MESADPLPEGVLSILDTDLYKLTMQSAVLKFYPTTRKSPFPGAYTVLIGRRYLRLHQSYP